MPQRCLGDQELQRLGGTPSELTAQACVCVCVCVCTCVHGREGGCDAGCVYESVYTSLNDCECVCTRGVPGSEGL